ncbi:hypothetical protein [Thermomonospora cellulosilytica]|uniref:Uncharacterized protein n=1 Tax=Thermomonospora cellulosilytica TaxID=1411118 RepID=A0A7W3RCJ4_9ACTN|nr:hypothetical protein [Thermomonospora cellulosilytica]MBA9007981.1 hypothetical protein [Thermomonospora cellulosilytica]
MSTGGAGMSNGARHGLGFLLGLVAAPVIFGLLLFGTERLIRANQQFQDGPERWIGAVFVLLAAAVVGLLIGSRVSPLASLVCGGILALVNLPWLQLSSDLAKQVFELVPNGYGNSFITLMTLGVSGMIGGALMIGSLPPSRWRAATRRPAAGPQPPAWTPPPGAPAGQGAPPVPPVMHGGAPGGPPPAGVPVGPGAQPSFGPGAPYVPPQPVDDAPPPPQYGPPASQPRQDQDDDEPGEWTRMYGGRSARKDDGAQS